MLKIQKSTDPIEINQVVVLLYGQPGIGKTSLSFTADAPLLLDFDNGAYRSGFRKDSVPVERWEDVAGMTADDLSQYKTLVVDTAGRALDALAAHLIQNNPKLAMSSGALTLKGYGELKASFAAWVKRIRSMGLDLVLVAHDKEDKNGDDVIVRPDVQGGSYHELFKIADSAGYLHSSGKNRVLEFSPSDSWVAKNPAGFDPIEVPHLAASPDFMASIVQAIKDALGALSQDSKAVMDAVAERAAEVAAITDAQGMNTMLAAVNTLDGPVKTQVKALMNKRVKKLGLEYDKKEKCFTAAPDDAA